jgi:hypothetical protein
MLGADPASAALLEVEEGSLASSSMSAHRAPFNSDFNAELVACSFAGVMAPDGALLDCLEAVFDA